MKKWLAALALATAPTLASAQQINVICSALAEWCNGISTAYAKATGVTVNLARGSRRVMGPISLGAGGGSLGAMAAEMEPGDRLNVIIEGVQRRNFRGDISDVPMGNLVQNIPLY